MTGLTRGYGQWSCRWPGQVLSVRNGAHTGHGHYKSDASGEEVDTVDAAEIKRVAGERTGCEDGIVKTAESAH